VLCFSPIGDAFRTRVRMFPSLVNCCTIDWFQEWPQDALLWVARRFLNAIEMENEVREKCVEMVQYFHESTSNWAKDFYKKLKRKYYVTPTSYIELITTFKNLLAEKRKEVQQNINKYENGYEKIITTEKSVEGMQKNLIELQPKLKEAAAATEVKMKEVAEKKGEADILKENIQKEEAIVQVAVNEANAIK
jgi:dynein heavy chain